ncbi:MAG: dual specificity protein phosphatase family protein [Desulfobacterales bacterium]
MSSYQLTWITDNLAVGHAPMSYDDLDAIRAEGIDAIVNLCGEFCDLHELEAGRGFEVYYLPIADECAPDMAEMEKGLAWLDEAVYLGKKVLIHCRFGIGRTGTFLTSYLIRRGLGLKRASRQLKAVRAKPSSWHQWRMLKKYSKQSGTLQVREPSLENRRIADLNAFFEAYDRLVQQVDPEGAAGGRGEACGREQDDCCFEHFQLSLMEAVYLFDRFNRTLSREARDAVIYRAVAAIKQSACRLTESAPAIPAESVGDIHPPGSVCPLNEGGECLLFPHRPLRCRLESNLKPDVSPEGIRETLNTLSRHLFSAFSDENFDPRLLCFSVAETVSGRFVQKYFDYLAGLGTPPRDKN